MYYSHLALLCLAVESSQSSHHAQVEQVGVSAMQRLLLYNRGEGRGKSLAFFSTSTQELSLSI